MFLYLGGRQIASRVGGSGPDRRRDPRYRTRHRFDGESLDRRNGIQGMLRDLSMGGCCLNLDRRIAVGTPIEIRCDIEGLGLRIPGKVVWAEETGTGVYHGIALTGYVSEEDALFHRLYVGRLARHAPTSPDGSGYFKGTRAGGGGAS